MIGTKEYFEEVTLRKYKVEPHILEFVNFDKYKNKKVLEVGCGIGTAAQTFVENGADYMGLDLSDSSIELAIKRFDLFNLKGKFLTGNIEDINNINNNKFDLIYSFGVLHHTPNIKKAIDNIYNLLKIGGEFKLMLYATNSLKKFEIDEGFDQFEAQSDVPIANTYTNDEVHKLLNKFKNINIEQNHIFPYKINEYKDYEYVKKDYIEKIPPKLFEFIETKLGWHLCITCNK